jgi:hypothetical protein
MAKFCRKCSKFLELENFYKTKNKSYIDGHIDWCKSCLYDYRKQKKSEKSEKIEDKGFFFEKGNFVMSFD